jgi:hypothetical protein
LDSRAGPGDQNDELSLVKPNPISNYFVNITNETINIAIILIKNLNPCEASKYATSNAFQLLSELATIKRNQKQRQCSFLHIP